MKKDYLFCSKTKPSLLLTKFQECLPMQRRPPEFIQITPLKVSKRTNIEGYCCENCRELIIDYWNTLLPGNWKRSKLTPIIDEKTVSWRLTTPEYPQTNSNYLIFKQSEKSEIFSQLSKTGKIYPYLSSQENENTNNPWNQQREFRITPLHPSWKRKYPQNEPEQW